VAGAGGEATRFDYDRGTIAGIYSGARTLDAAADAAIGDHLRAALAGRRVRVAADVGCGTGRFTQLIRRVTGAAVLGVDRSARMLAQAAADPALAGARWVRAAAEALPLRPRSLDLVFVWLVYHHLERGPAAVREWARVLRPGGALVIGQSTLEILDRISWMPFFPAARAVDAARMPARGALVDAAARAGLARTSVETLAFSNAPDWPSYAERLARRGISSLQLIGDAEFSAGLAAFRAWCAARPADEPPRTELDLFVFTAPA